MLLGTLKSLFSRSGRAGTGKFLDAYRHYEAGRLDEADAACAEVGDAPPADVDYLRGLIAQRRGDHAAAAEVFRAAIAGRPEEPTFRYSLGESLQQLGRHADARDAFAQYLERAAVDDPRRVRACIAAADCSLQQDDGVQAEGWRARAVALAGDDPSALTEAANALYADSEVDAARALLARDAFRGADPTAVRRAMMLPAIYRSREHIAEVRERLEGDLDALLAREIAPAEAPETQIGVLPFFLAYHDANNAGMMTKVAEVMRRARGAPADVALARAPGKRLRVGFVSTYFYSHSISRITLGHLRHLPRERFEVQVFSIEPADDPMSRAVAAAADRHVVLPNRLEAARQAIAEAKLDALVFADIGMHPTTYFLALHRLAPVQAVLWGHPVTTGMPTIDYFFTGRDVEIDAAPAHYTERLVRPDCFFLGGFERPAPVRGLPPAALALPAPLPPDARLHACLQPAFKHHPDVDAVFARILEGDPRAVILLLESRPAWRRQLQQRFAGDPRIDPARVLFLPPMHHARFMEVLASAHVVLDPLYFGGGNSSCEALALGLPVLTLPGSHAYGRLTYGLYREMQLEDCIVASPEHMAALALQLAREPERREALGRRILERCPVLFGRTDITAAFADFLDEAVRG